MTALVIIILIIIIIFASPLKIEVFLLRKDNLNREADIKIVLLWGLLKVSLKKIMVKRKKRNKNQKLKDNNNNKRLFNQLKKNCTPETLRVLLDFSKKIVGKIKCTKFDVNVKMSFADAALTAKAIGIVWSLINCTITLIKSNASLNTNPKIDVTPVYNNDLLLDCRLHFQFELKMYYIFSLTFKTIIALFVRRKINGRPSNSRFNENRYGKHQGNG